MISAMDSWSPHVLAEPLREVLDRRVEPRDGYQLVSLLPTVLRFD
jgi:hypothetical protein